MQRSRVLLPPGEGPSRTAHTLRPTAGQMLFSSIPGAHSHTQASTPPKTRENQQGAARKVEQIHHGGTLPTDTRELVICAPNGGSNQHKEVPRLRGRPAAEDGGQARNVLERGEGHDSRSRGIVPNRRKGDCRSVPGALLHSGTSPAFPPVSGGSSRLSPAACCAWPARLGAAPAAASLKGRRTGRQRGRKRTGPLPWAPLPPHPLPAGALPRCSSVCRPPSG